MNILFIHQNMPGQFKHLAAALARQAGNRVLFITRRGDREIPGVQRIVYNPHRQPKPETHNYLKSTEAAILHGQALARVLVSLQKQGFQPDIIIGHPGWGETLYVKDVFPNVPLLNYCEFFYRAEGQDVGFDPAYPVDLDARCRLRTRTTPLLLALESCDRGITPTQWQQSTHPAEYQPKIRVIHEGIDTDTLKPNPEAHLPLGDGRILHPGDPVVTYVARNLEPYRGFPQFIRALPRILAGHPDAQVLVVGADDVSYGARPAEGKTWREVMLEEVAFDRSRVHFLGHLPYDQYRNVLALSAAHVYLTYPFVLSWSMLESMAMGCLIIGSDTAPVREVIEDGVNGRLVNFFSPDAIAERVIEALRSPEHFAPMRESARQTVVDRYRLVDCLMKQMLLVKEMVR